MRPSGSVRTYQGRGFSLDYLDNWDTFQDADSAAVTIAPKASLVTGQNGQTQVGYGIISAYYLPPDRRPNLQRDTEALLKQLMDADPAMRRTGQARGVRVGGQAATLTPLESTSPYRGNTGQQRETDMLLTVARPEGLFYVVFIAPEAEWTAAQPAFDGVVSSLRFSN